MRKSFCVYGLIMLVVFFANLTIASSDFGSKVNGDEPILYVERFGRGSSMIVSNGYLFVDYQYVPSPYVIERTGQAVVVNGIVVNCLYKDLLPDKFETRSTEIVGKNNKKFTWTSQPHPASNLKETADSYVGLLAEWLRTSAVVLSKTQFMALQSKPISEAGMAKRLPVIGKIGLEEFPRALLAAVSEQALSNVWKSARTNCAQWNLAEKDTIRLIELAKVSTNLIERLEKEIAELNAPKIPPYAILSSDLAVVEISKHELKLDVVFENGMPPSINDDWIIEDIQFETNATRVVATRLGHSPLPKTKSIRSQSRLTATIISLQTGEFVSSAITDKPESAIQLNGIKYQVVDIRPSAKAVLLKECKTGQRIFVTCQKEKVKE